MSEKVNLPVKRILLIQDEEIKDMKVGGIFASFRFRLKPMD